MFHLSLPLVFHTASMTRTTRTQRAWIRLTICDHPPWFEQITLLFHRSHFILLLLLNTTLQPDHRSSCCLCVCATCHAAVPQTAIAVSWLLQRQLHGAKNPCGRNQTHGALSGWRLNGSKRGLRKNLLRHQQERYTYSTLLNISQENDFVPHGVFWNRYAFWRIHRFNWNPETRCTFVPLGGRRLWNGVLGWSQFVTHW